MGDKGRPASHVAAAGSSKNRARNSSSVASLPSVRSTACWLTDPPLVCVWRLRGAKGAPDPRTLSKLQARRGFFGKLARRQVARCAVSHGACAFPHGG